MRAAQGRDGEGSRLYRASHRSEEQKHPTPALPFAFGEREGAERLLNAFGSGLVGDVRSPTHSAVIASTAWLRLTP